MSIVITDSETDVTPWRVAFFGDSVSWGYQIHPDGSVTYQERRMHDDKVVSGISYVVRPATKGNQP